MKKVLIITYYWPPSGGAGVQRSLKFVKYLKLLGCEPIVLTVKPDSASYPLIDNSLLKEIPEGVKVYRTKSFEPLKIISGLFGKDKVPYGGFANSKKESIPQYVLRFIRGNFFIPDARVGWNKFAIKEALEIIKSESIEHVFISSPPHSSQLIGLELKKVIPRLRLVVDLRDPWTDIYYYGDLLHTNIAANIDAKLERKVLENADAILVVSNEIKQKFLKKSNLIHEGKVVVIPNGYDETDFEAVAQVDGSKFVISYVGTISEIYNPEVFFKVMEGVIHSNSNVNFKINFIGSAPSSIKELAKQYNLTSVCDWIPHVEHSKAIDYMKSSNLLLLVIPDDASAKGILTGKLFEYMGSNVPILAIGPVDGDASKIINECNAGVMFERNQSVELESWVMKQISIYLNLENPVPVNFELKNKYSRLNLTKKLHDIIFLS